MNYNLIVFILFIIYLIQAFKLAKLIPNKIVRCEVCIINIITLHIFIFI